MINLLSTIRTFKANSSLNEWSLVSRWDMYPIHHHSIFDTSRLFNGAFFNQRVRHVFVTNDSILNTFINKSLINNNFISNYISDILTFDTVTYNILNNYTPFSNEFVSNTLINKITPNTLPELNYYVDTIDSPVVSPSTILENKCPSTARWKDEYWPLIDKIDWDFDAWSEGFDGHKCYKECKQLELTHKEMIYNSEIHKILQYRPNVNLGEVHGWEYAMNQILQNNRRKFQLQQYLQEINTEWEYLTLQDIRWGYQLLNWLNIFDLCDRLVEDCVLELEWFKQVPVNQRPQLMSPYWNPSELMIPRLKHLEEFTQIPLCDRVGLDFHDCPDLILSLISLL